jgi:hypothetical protein
MFHQFDPMDEYTILCRRTSKSLDASVFTLWSGGKDKETKSSLKQVKTMNDISIQQFVIVKQDEKQYLAQIIEINQVQQEVIVQCYKPGFPNSSYIKFFNKTDNKLKINW